MTATSARVSAPQWGCNLYATQEDAEREGRVFADGRPLRVWRTRDGLYDWTLGPNPRSLPHLADALLVVGALQNHRQRSAGSESVEGEGQR